jgi:C_GCAxxG_C_C family probable redox protein
MNREIMLHRTEDWIEQATERARYIMENHESCAQSILAAFMEALEIQNPLLLRAAGGFHGGMMSSLICGIHTAGLMVLGLLMGRENLEEGLNGLVPIIQPAQELMARLNQRLGSHSCKELTGVDFTDLNQAMAFYNISGENKKCIDRVARGTREIALFLKEKQESGELFRIG